jgi:hypothetical protein
MPNWIYWGVGIAWADIALVAWALCRASADADRRLGYKD